jgi:hypothetical protein
MYGVCKCVKRRKKTNQLKNPHTHIRSFMVFTPSYSNADKKPYTIALVTNPSFLLYESLFSPFMSTYQNNIANTTHTKQKKKKKEKKNQPSTSFALLLFSTPSLYMQAKSRT